MIKPVSLTLKNFKAIGTTDQSIDLAPITLLFGPNSAGKSSILQALIYFREILVKGNLNPDKTELGGDWLDLGGFKNLVYGHEIEEQIQIGMKFELSSSDLPDFLSEHEYEYLEELGFSGLDDFFNELESAYVELTLRWSHILNTPIVEKYECCLNDQLIAVITASLDGKQVSIDSLPLAYAGFQEPNDFLPEEQSLAETLTNLLSSSVLERGQVDFSSLTDQERPFIQQSIYELEELLQGDKLPPKEVLVKLLEELKYRSTRRAYALEKNVKEALSSNESSIQLIGLSLQKDALPDVIKGLQIDDDNWKLSEEREEFVYKFDKGTQLFCMNAVNMAVCGPLICLQKWLDNFSYIGPLRDLPPRDIKPRKTLDKARWAKGLAAWELLPVANQSFIDEVNFWLGKNCLDTGYQVWVKRFRELEDSHPIYSMLENELDLDQQILIKELLSELPEKTEVCLLEEKNDLEVMPHDIGVGISQLFPVLVLSILQKHGLISIEQPELHIHPKLQVELADVFVRYAKESNVLFLLETHSEHLMLRLLRRIRQATEGEITDEELLLKAEDIAVQYVEPSAYGTQFKRLRVNDDGDFIDEWPQGFFDERDEELFF